MKIAVVTQNFPVREQPYRGHSVYQTVLRMAQSADVKVYSPHPRYITWLRPKSRSWKEIDTSYSPDGVDTLYLSYPAVAGLTRPVNGLVCARHVEPLLKADLPDVILSYWIYPDGDACIRMGQNLGIPVVVKAIGSDLNQQLDPWSKRLTRRVLQRADIVLTVSGHLRTLVIDMGIPANRVHAVLNGCDTKVFYYGDRGQARRDLGTDDSSLILYVGRLDLAKGLSELVEATARVVRNYPRTKLVLIGDGPAQAQLEAQSRELGAADRLLFVGACTSMQVAKWMRASNLLALPSFREGCPNVVLEALSSGLPVIASNVGGVPELVDDTSGILVPPHDPAVLAEAIQSGLQRSWNSVHISGRMKRGWEQVAAETLRICESTLHADQVADAAIPVEAR